MLKIDVPGRECFDEETERLMQLPGVTLQLEHSLIAVSRWESIHKKPFLDNDIQKTEKEVTDYIRCMSLNSNVPDDVFENLPNDVLLKIQEYINDKPTATVISEPKNAKGRSGSTQKITSELVYYWMVYYNIPAEYAKWNIERLLMLIRICAEYEKEHNGKGNKKTNQSDILRQNASLNAARRAKYGNL